MPVFYAAYQGRRETWECTCVGIIQSADDVQAVVGAGQWRGQCGRRLEGRDEMVAGVAAGVGGRVGADR